MFKEEKDEMIKMGNGSLFCPDMVQQRSTFTLELRKSLFF